MCGEEQLAKILDRKILEKRNSCRIVRACARIIGLAANGRVVKSHVHEAKYVRKQRNLLQLDRWIYLRWTDGAIYLAHNCLL
jgi:hypothetical protein